MISKLNFLIYLTRVLAPRSITFSHGELSKLGESIGLEGYGADRRKDLSNLLIQYLRRTE
jgi:hypothetical protein